MGLFRFFLYFSCIISIGWSILVFTGPSALKWLIVYNSDGRVNPTNISLTPSLDINVAKIDFFFEPAGSSQSFSGFSRSVKIDWSILGDKPFIDITLNKLMIENFAFVEDLNISTPALREINFGNIPFHLETGKIEINKFGKFNGLSLMATYEKKENSIRDLSFSFFEPHSLGNTSWAAENLVGFISQVELQKPIKKQELKIHAKISDVLIQKHNSSVEEVIGDLTTFDSKMDYNLQFKKVNLAELNTKIQKVNAVGSFENGFQPKETLIEFLEGYVGEVNRFDFLKTRIREIKTNKYEALIDGQLGTLEIANDNYYIGTLSQSKFIFDVEFTKNFSDINGDLSLTLENTDDVKINGLLSIDAELVSPGGFLGCFSLNCEFSDLNSSYQITLGDEWVRGKVSCLDRLCIGENLDYDISASDTNKVINIVKNSQAVNPLALYYLHGLLNQNPALQERN